MAKNGLMCWKCNRHDLLSKDATIKYQQDRAVGMQRAKQRNGGRQEGLVPLLASALLGSSWDGSCCLVGPVWSFGMLLFSHENILSSSLLGVPLLATGPFWRRRARRALMIIKPWSIAPVRRYIKICRCIHSTGSTDSESIDAVYRFPDVISFLKILPVGRSSRSRSTGTCTMRSARHLFFQQWHCFSGHGISKAWPV